MYPENVMCHGENPSVFRLGQPEWQVREDGLRHCSYCGSVHPEDLLKLFEAGAHLEGSDWKYGYPHKYYIENAPKGATKFYTDHLKDLIGQPEFEVVARAIREKFSGLYYPTVTFIEDEGQLRYITGGKSYDDVMNWHKEQVAKREQQKSE